MLNFLSIGDRTDVFIRTHVSISLSTKVLYKHQNVLIRLQPRYLCCASALENKLVHGFHSVSLKLQGEKMSGSVDSSSPLLTFCNINKAENKLHYKLIFQYYT